MNNILGVFGCISVALALIILISRGTDFTYDPSGNVFAGFLFLIGLLLTIFGFRK